MRLYQCMLINNRCYTTNATIKPKGVMVHSTGANNPWLKRYVQPAPRQPGAQEILDLVGVNKNGNAWNRADIDACVHAFIGKCADGSVATIQTLPWNHRGWHAGRGTSGRSANDTHISFEICEDGLNNLEYFNQVYKEAVELVAHLCNVYDLDPTADGVIICHQDGYKSGIASNHGDIYNWFPRHKKTMVDFRRDVIAAMQKGSEDGMKYYAYLEDVPEWYKPSIEKAINAGALQGTGDSAINVSDDMCRILTVLDRLGKLD